MKGFTVKFRTERRLTKQEQELAFTSAIKGNRIVFPEGCILEGQIIHELKHSDGFMILAEDKTIHTVPSNNIVESVFAYDTAMEFLKDFENNK